VDGSTSQGGKSADYNARDVIKPMLDLVLEDTEENTLRPLIEAETIRVIEALVLGAAIEVRPEISTLHARGQCSRG
jgi:hypothetical protein